MTTSPDTPDKTPEDKPVPAPTEPTISAPDFVANDFINNVPFAGLLSHDPKLRDAELTRTEWQKRLDAFLVTPTP